MRSAFGAAVMVLVAVDLGVRVADAAVVTAMAEIIEVLNEDTRGPIGLPFFQKTQFKLADTLFSAVVRQPTPNNHRLR